MWLERSVNTRTVILRGTKTAYFMRITLKSQMWFGLQPLTDNSWSNHNTLPAKTTIGLQVV